MRERYAEEAPRVVIVADRRPAMSLYPADMPWLSKPDAMVAAGNLIADSAAKARGLIGYLDYASASAASGDSSMEVPFWRPPHAQADFWRVKESHLHYPLYGAPEDTLEQAFAHLAPMRRSLPAGTFVFILSDFLSPPSEAAWAWIVELPWELVPVVIQDPVWEQSFPRRLLGRRPARRSADGEAEARPAEPPRGARATGGQRGAAGRDAGLPRGAGARPRADLVDRPGGDLHAVPRVGRAAAGGGARLVVTPRRLFVAGVVAAVILAAAVGLIAWNAWDKGGGPGLGEEPIVGTALLTPEQHLFGDAVRARVELIVDSERVDPDSVEIGANFDPYRELRPVEATRSQDGTITKLRYDYVLGCLVSQCLPRGTGRVEIGGVAVNYLRRGESEPSAATVEWVPIRAAGRIDPNELEQAALRSDFVTSRRRPTASRLGRSSSSRSSLPSCSPSARRS